MADARIRLCGARNDYPAAAAGKRHAAALAHPRAPRADKQSRLSERRDGGGCAQNRAGPKDRDCDSPCAQLRAQQKHAADWCRRGLRTVDGADGRARGLRRDQRQLAEYAGASHLAVARKDARDLRRDARAYWRYAASAADSAQDRAGPGTRRSVSNLRYRARTET